MGQFVQAGTVDKHIKSLEGFGNLVHRLFELFPLRDINNAVDGRLSVEAFATPSQSAGIPPD